MLDNVSYTFKQQVVFQHFFPIIDVYNVELILSGVMKQELEWGQYLFMLAMYFLLDFFQKIL